MTTPVGVPVPPSTNYTLVVWVPPTQPSQGGQVVFWDFSTEEAVTDAAGFLVARGCQCDIIKDQA